MNIADKIGECSFKHGPMVPSDALLSALAHDGASCKSQLHPPSSVGHYLSTSQPLVIHLLWFLLHGGLRESPPIFNSVILLIVLQGIWMVCGSYPYFMGIESGLEKLNWPSF